MNTNRQTAATTNSARKLAIAAGLFYLITHVTAIGAPVLYAPILNSARYTGGAASDTQVIAGALLDVICTIAIVGTSVALFPIAKRQHEGIAMGYVGLRTLEAGVIAVGALPMLATVALRQTGISDPETITTFGSILVAFYKWTALIGPGLVCGTNTVLMAYLMYKSRLVPRFIPVLGLVGGPLIFAVTVARMFGLAEYSPSWLGIVVIPIFAWEVTLAIRLIVKGFNPSASVSEPAQTTANDLLSAA